MMRFDKNLIEAYKDARKIIEGITGSVPEQYKLFFFVDPSLYDSVLLQTLNAGSPKATISSNELSILQALKEDSLSPNGIDLFYAARNPKIFLPDEHINGKLGKELMKARLIHAFAKALIVENTQSRFPDNLQNLYRNDAIISELFSNNVYEFIMERNAPWVWQYFQDFTASLRLLSLYEMDHFYVPPNTIRGASIFYNYLLEIKDITKERAKYVRKAPLFDLILNGFAEYILNQYINTLDKSVKDYIVPRLKGNLGSPLGVIGERFILEYGEKPDEIFSNSIKLKNDFELVKVWNRAKTKEELEIIRDNLSNRAVLWHKAKNSYWSDLWPLRANAFDKIANSYVGKLQRRKYQYFSELLNDSPTVTYHGYVELKDREVVVFGIQEDTIGQEQLLILRNHLQAIKDDKFTPLPGLPNVIVFRKFSGMHVASYLGIADEKNRRYPRSPYDLPVVVRAIQVTRRKGAYKSEVREDDEGKIDLANYEHLSKLTEPQHRAIRYLIRQGEFQ